MNKFMIDVFDRCEEMLKEYPDGCENAYFFRDKACKNKIDVAAQSVMFRHYVASNRELDELKLESWWDEYSDGSILFTHMMDLKFSLIGQFEDVLSSWITKHGKLERDTLDDFKCHADNVFRVYDSEDY